MKDLPSGEFAAIFRLVLRVWAMRTSEARGRKWSLVSLQLGEPIPMALNTVSAILFCVSLDIEAE